MRHGGVDRRGFLRTAAAGAAGVTLCGARPAYAAGIGAPPAPAPAGAAFELRFRQVHLDYHTSPHIPDVAAAFDPEEFVSTLVRARVDSVTCFARCHHGYIYYDTKRFPERRHPHLERNLLAEQIEACHRRDIRVPIYVTVQWDQYTADAEPGWRMVTETGALQGTPPFEPGFYRRLCLNSPYPDFLKAHLEELFAVVPVDGLFLDIVAGQDCSCPRCRAEMDRRGMDASVARVRQEFGREVTHAFQRDLTAFIRRLDRDCSIFYNGGHVGPEQRHVAAAYTHWELESLPSGGWGYLHFPVSQRYARTLGLECLGMTGKFHTSWGDFHSLKNLAALQFECFQMLALGAKCSVGDQLHPSGRIDGPTYDLIGAVYAEVERKEPWCRGARPVVDVGVFSPEEFTGGRTPPPALGATRILQEGAHQFDFIDTATEELDRYRLLVLPDDIAVGAELGRKLQAYLQGGGALVASHRSGLEPEGKAFALPLGVRLVGEAPFSPDFVRPRAALAKGLPAAELVVYRRALEVEPLPGAEVLADAVVPYFNRTYRHYSSHRHTPSSGRTGYAAAVRQGRAVYFAHPLFTQYAANAPRWCKQLVLNAVDLLLSAPMLRHRGPSTVLAAVNQQAAERRLVVHLLHYVPERRGQDFDVIEDVIPLFDLDLDLRAPERVTEVTAVPQGRRLAFQQRAGRIWFRLPRLDGHQMIAVRFA
ncbi:MAG TPA: alpha-amylase family protein [Vicinamibacteria bacterium]|nr:alpha-amylase family protein [Vicinamibacteria bacterium]